MLKNVGPDLDPNCLTCALMVLLKEFFEKNYFEKNQQMIKKHVGKELKPIIIISGYLKIDTKIFITLTIGPVKQKLSA